MDASVVRPYLQAGFGAPERQNRWTVAFRLILAVPHFVVLVALGFVAYVVVVIGWFGALFMGRLPRWGADYLRGFVVYATRVYAYLWLMTDAYPPFGWVTGETYPVNVDVPYGPVRRLAVLFRVFLLVPAQIVAGLVTAGFNVVLVFVWLIVLVAGRMPLSLFGAVAAMLRFQARYYAYALMLTGKYPGELFGDAPRSPLATPPGFAGAAPAFPPGAAGTAPTLPPPVPPYPGTEAPGSAPPTGAPAAPPWAPPGASAGSGPPPGSVPAPPMGSVPAPPMGSVPAPPTGSVPAPPTGAPRTARLVLAATSKRLLVLFLVLGVLEYAGIAVAVAVAGSSNRAAFNALLRAHDTLGGEISAAQGQLQSCGSTNLQCNETYQGQLADAFSGFGAAVSAIHVSSGAQDDEQKLESDIGQLTATLHQMASAPDVATYQSELTQAQSLANQFDADYSALAASLLF